MVLVSYSGREINAKLVYYGPGLSGKTTNLETIYGSIPQGQRGKMVSMKTKTERTLFFDFLPVHLGEVSGFRTRFLLYTVPGQVYYNATRKLVLKGVDAVVFVADSKRGKMDENVESLENLKENLGELGLTLAQVPWVIQYNKRDLSEVYTLDELESVLNPEKVPAFEAVATTGQGVSETFKGISRLLLRKLAREIGVSVAGATDAAVAPASPAPPPGLAAAASTSAAGLAFAAPASAAGFTAARPAAAAEPAIAAGADAAAAPYAAAPPRAADPVPAPSFHASPFPPPAAPAPGGYAAGHADGTMSDVAGAAPVRPAPAPERGAGGDVGPRLSRPISLTGGPAHPWAAAEPEPRPGEPLPRVSPSAPMASPTPVAPAAPVAPLAPFAPSSSQGGMEPAQPAPSPRSEPDDQPYPSQSIPPPAERIDPGAFARRGAARDEELSERPASVGERLRRWLTRGQDRDRYVEEELDTGAASESRWGARPPRLVPEEEREPARFTSEEHATLGLNLTSRPAASMAPSEENGPREDWAPRSADRREPAGPDAAPFSADAAPRGAEAASNGADVAPRGVEAPPFGADVASWGAEAPPFDSDVAPSGAEAATWGANAAPSGTNAAASGAAEELTRIRLVAASAGQPQGQPLARPTAPDPAPSAVGFEAVPSDDALRSHVPVQASATVEIRGVAPLTVAAAPRADVEPQPTERLGRYEDADLPAATPQGPPPAVERRPARPAASRRPREVILPLELHPEDLENGITLRLVIQAAWRREEESEEDQRAA